MLAPALPWFAARRLAWLLPVLAAPFGAWSASDQIGASGEQLAEAKLAEAFFEAGAAGGRELKSSSAVVVVIGESPSVESKCVSVCCTLVCASNAGDPSYRLNNDIPKATNTFDVSVSQSAVCATRTDQKSGWAMDLTIECQLATTVTTSSASITTGTTNLTVTRTTISTTSSSTTLTSTTATTTSTSTTAVTITTTSIRTSPATTANSTTTLTSTNDTTTATSTTTVMTTTTLTTTSTATTTTTSSTTTTSLSTTTTTTSTSTTTATTTTTSTTTSTATTTTTSSTTTTFTSTTTTTTSIITTTTTTSTSTTTATTTTTLTTTSTATTTTTSSTTTTFLSTTTTTTSTSTTTATTTMTSTTNGTATTTATTSTTTTFTSTTTTTSTSTTNATTTTTLTTTSTATTTTTSTTTFTSTTTTTTTATPTATTSTSSITMNRTASTTTSSTATVTSATTATTSATATVSTTTTATRSTTTTYTSRTTTANVFTSSATSATSTATASTTTTATVSTSTATAAVTSTALAASTTASASPSHRPPASDVCLCFTTATYTLNSTTTTSSTVSSPTTSASSTAVASNTTAENSKGAASTTAAMSFEDANATGTAAAASTTTTSTATRSFMSPGATTAAISETTTANTTSTTTPPSSIETTAATASTTTPPSSIGAAQVASPAETEVLLQALQAQETALVENLLRGNATSVTVSMPGLTLTARKLSPASAGQGGKLAVPVDGADAEVAVPTSLFSALGVQDVVMTVAVFDVSTLATMSSGGGGKGGPPVQVKAAINIDLRTLSSSGPLNVSGLPEPIEISMPANRTAGMECAYWDPDLRAWATNGTTLAPGADGSRMVCRTTHLSLFGAILKGFLATFACSQLALLNAEAISKLAKGRWYMSSGAIVFWVTLAVLLFLLVLSVAMDRRRRRLGVLSDENFLIPVLRDAEPKQEEKEPEQDEDEPVKRGLIATAGCCITFCCCTLIQWCRESSAVRDAVDDIMSNWFSNFSEVRDFFESIWDGLGMIDGGIQFEGGRLSLIVMMSLNGLMKTSARRQTGAALWLSEEDVAFVIEDEGFQHLLLQYGDGSPTPKNGGQSISKDSPGSVCRTASMAARQRLKVWGDLHRAIEDNIDHPYLRAGRATDMPFIMGRIFLVQNPIGALLVQSMFISSTLRTFLFAIDLCGQLLLATVFFQGNGTSSECGSIGQDSDGEKIGRLLAVGLGSVFIAGLPVMFLGSLHNREVKKLPGEDSAEWQKELRVWRIQDRMIWTFGSLYLLFCLFFVCLFFANVDEGDTQEWSKGALVNVTMGTIIVPGFTALFMPVFTFWLLGAASCLTRKTRDSIIRERIENSRSGNLAPPPIVSI